MKILLRLVGAFLLLALSALEVRAFDFALLNEIFGKFNPVMDYPQDIKCQNVQISWDKVLMPYKCLIKKPNIYIPFDKVLDLVWDQIDEFEGYYQLDNPHFFYTGANIKRNQEFAQQAKAFWDFYPSLWAYFYLRGADKTLEIPLSWFAWKQVQNRTFWVATKSLQNRGSCRLQNYMLAIDTLDWQILPPWEQIVFNDKLIDIPQSQYCKGKSQRQYLFYAGVCGASTQFFRNALLNPFLQVVERRPHSRRYKDFYDDVVRGDDASVYETYKRLTIKNIGDSPIALKVFKKDARNIYLVSVAPTSNPYVVEVHKQNLDKFKAKVSKSVWQWKKLIDFQSWVSNYLWFK